MNDLRAQMVEDRALRDAAKALLDADVENVREDFSSKSLALRAKDRVTEGASEVYEEAVGVAGDNKGALIAIIAALVMWFARNPITDLFASDETAPAADDHTEADIEDLTSHDENSATAADI
ncbi:hypothetical protein [Qipengyuania sp. DGS5-3]|uniref:hypothetical protein n=1 Tax=Qipengyuania sp. DGS5-3 TaxID=3349632 RepID=UPI0036D383B2